MSLMCICVYECVEVTSCSCPRLADKDANAADWRCHPERHILHIIAACTARSSVMRRSSFSIAFHFFDVHSAINFLVSASRNEAPTAALSSDGRAIGFTIAAIGTSSFEHRCDAIVDNRCPEPTLCSLILSRNILYSLLQTKLNLENVEARTLDPQRPA